MLGNSYEPSDSQSSVIRKMQPVFILLNERVLCLFSRPFFFVLKVASQASRTVPTHDFEEAKIKQGYLIKT